MIKLLDCTLRDGGYYTDWDFDEALVASYFELIDKLPVEYVEIGYRNSSKNQYFGEFYYLPMSTLKRIRRYTSKKLSIMLDAKYLHDTNMENLLHGLREYISLIRIATDSKSIRHTIQFTRRIKRLGFKVAINLMYISEVTANSCLFDYIDEIEETAEVLYLVDSFGSIYPDSLQRIIEHIDAISTIPLGFHGHNNLELAFSNTLKAIECGIVYIDSTVTGMGRGAGNLKTELILSYLKSRRYIDVDLNYLAKLTEPFLRLQSKYKWGTNLAYMISGSYSLPQKDVMKAFSIDRYSLSGIVNQLQDIEDKRLEVFRSSRPINRCLIIGGGISVSTHFNIINEYLAKNQDILLIHSTTKYIDRFMHTSNDQYLAVAGDLLLLHHVSSRIQKYILGPSPRKVTSRIEDPKDFYELEKISFIDQYIDSPLAISLQITLDLNSNEIFLVGFDGYGHSKDKKELYLTHENQDIINHFSRVRVLVSLTKTTYQNLIHKSIYGFLL